MAEPSAEVLRTYIRQNFEKLFKIPNVNSVGVGYKISNKVNTGKKCISFTVGSKVSLESLDGNGIPEMIKIDDNTQIETDVVERTYCKHAKEINMESQIAQADRRKGFADPIAPGISISREDQPPSAGTAGCIVYDATTGQPYVLSNLHVLQSLDGEVGGNIVQPGLVDNNNSQRSICGKVVRSYVGKAGDCAIATLEGRNFTTEIMDLGVSVERVGEPELDDIVAKSGRTTGVTYGKVIRVDVVTKVDYGQKLGEQAVGCFEIGVDPAHVPTGGQISKPGDSGSAWMFVENGKASNMMLGLHFAGNDSGQEDVAVACLATSVFEKLGILPRKPVKLEKGEITEGTGYDRGFLGIDVPIPVMASQDGENDVYTKDNVSIFNYNHFSLSLSKSRKFAYWVVWNIDGGRMIKVKRANNFRFDSRIDQDAQAGNDLYLGNDLDRGHIARCADLLWGENVTESRSACSDSFYYTNITPQHKDFNQGAPETGFWYFLEQAVYDEVDVNRLRVSVFGGPIFADDDPVYRGYKIPAQFWKIIYYMEEGSTTLKARGFVLSQKNLLGDLEVFELPTFKVFETPLSVIGQMTGLKLFDPSPVAVEGLERKITRVQSLEQIKW